MAVPHTDEGRATSTGRGARRVRRLMWIGLAFLAVPCAMFAVFAIGEAAGREPGWWSHLLQVAIMVLLVALAWMRPRVGGPVLIAVGVGYSVLMLAVGQDLVSRLVVIAIFFAPLIAAGGFFMAAGHGTRGGGIP
jgi:FtsH-binding integral membrane protein